MNEREAFMAHIIAHPEDMTARLVFADWLEENGEERRAELIRVQIELSQIPTETADSDHLRLMEWNLLRELGPQIRAELPQLNGIEWRGPTRGFCEEIAVRNRWNFYHNTDRIFSLAPLRHLTLHAPSPGGFRFMAEQPELAMLMQLPQLQQIRILDLRAQLLNDHDAIALARSPHLGQLETILLSFNQIGNPGVAALTQPSVLPSLRRLDLQGNAISGRGARSLIDWQLRPQIIELNLENNLGINNSSRQALRTAFGDRVRV